MSLYAAKFNAFGLQLNWLMGLTNKRLAALSANDEVKAERLKQLGGEHPRWRAAVLCADSVGVTRTSLNITWL